MPFTDTHCHLDFEELRPNLTECLDLCYREGIREIVIPGVSRSNWSCLKDLAMRFECDQTKPSLHLAFGLHPFFISEHQFADLDVLEAELDQGGIHILGEIGLDSLRPDMEKQVLFFESQLKLANSFDVPVILHSVKTHSQVVSRLRRYGVQKGVVHAFSGSYQDALSFIDQGMHIGIGGVITWPRAKKTRETVSKLPLSSIVLETDAPDSPVSGKRKGEGSPEDLLTIFQSLCALRKEAPKEIEVALENNSRRLLGCGG